MEYFIFDDQFAEAERKKLVTHLSPYSTTLLNLPFEN